MGNLELKKLLSILELHRIRLLVFVSKISAGNPLQFDMERGCLSMQFQIFPLANAANGMESFLFIAFLAHRPYNVNCGVGFKLTAQGSHAFPVPTSLYSACLPISP